MYKYHFFEYFQPMLSHAESCLTHPNKTQVCGRIWKWLDAVFVVIFITIGARIVTFIARQRKLYTKYLNESEQRDRLIEQGFIDEGDSINGMPLEKAKTLIRDGLVSNKD